MKKKSNSKRWLKEHFSDQYVKRSKQDGFRARSVYKLIEIDERHKIIKPNMVVVDLGSAPGGWSEYLAKIIGPKGKIFALDILSMNSIGGVDFIQGDFTEDSVMEILRSKLNNQKVDLVLSDMAPNLSGIKDVDQMRSLELASRAFNFASTVLKLGGSFLVKIFHGAGFEEFLQLLRKDFKEVKVVKPDASRSRSSEVFLLGKSKN